MNWYWMLRVRELKQEYDKSYEEMERALMRISKGDYNSISKKTNIIPKINFKKLNDTWNQKYELTIQNYERQVKGLNNRILELTKMMK
jgi:phage regulator Rha-like protein